MAIEIKFPIGRIVMGHPVTRGQVKDDDGRPVMYDNGTPAMEVFFAVAYVKGGESDWKQTAWGQSLVTQAQTDWPNGEWQQPTFAWKVIDGDSGVPNKNGRIPNQREGFPGHWVVTFKTRLEGLPSCYHVGKYHPTQVIQNPKEIKCGDYVRVIATAQGNNAKTGRCKSPGLYINPEVLSLDRAGVPIVTRDTIDAAAAFGSDTPELPAGAQVDTAVAAPQNVAAATTPANVQPNHEFVNGVVDAPPPPSDEAPAPPAHVMLPAANGVTYEAFIAKGWKDADLVKRGYMQAQ